jgi:hypothetical protein
MSHHKKAGYVSNVELHNRVWQEVCETHHSIKCQHNDDLVESVV